MAPRDDAETIRIPVHIANRLIEHARSAMPNESCALLGGNPHRRRVLSMHPARNRLASPYRYDVAPDDLVRIVHRIERDGQELLAIFHSHPASSANPSPSDIREARWPVVHLIASRTGDAWTMRGWRIEGSAAREVGVGIEGPDAATGPSVRDRGRGTGTPPPAGA